MSYLKDGEKSSSTRLIFVVGSFWAMALTTFLATKSVAPEMLLALYAGLQGTLITLKLGQKQQEKK